MASTKKLLALGLLLLAAFVAAEAMDKEDAESELQAAKKKDRKPNVDKKIFDYFFFVQQWPGSFCDTTKGCCFPVTGEPGPFFGIHGLWPNRNDGTYPATCTNEQLDPSQLKEVLDNLNKNWGTLACSSSHNEDFWEHEWSKHGTCSGFTQHQYFEAALNLYNDYDITGALRDAGIVPDDRFYPMKDISAALTKLLGFTPEIECNTDPEGNRQLYQVYICAAKDGKTLIRCPKPIREPCRGSVQFPAFGPTSTTETETETDAGFDEL